MNELQKSQDYVEMKLSLNEVILFHELLNIETVLQIRHLILKEIELEEKIVDIVTVFDDFRSFSDRLIFLKTDIKSVLKNMPPNTETEIVITKPMLKALGLLCTHTSKALIPNTKADDLWKEHGLVIIEKIANSMNSPTVTYEEARNKLSKETEDSSFRINVLNNKAMA